MSLTRKKPAELNTSSTVKAAKRTQKASAAAAANTVKAAKQAQKAGSAAAANAATAAQNAAVTAQNAAGLAQTAAQNAAVTAQNAAQNAAVVATNAAQTAAVVATNAAQTASDAAQNVNKGVRQGVFSARRWAAPRLESAADYTSKTLAPKVSDALRATARQVSPPDPKSSRKRVLAWTALGAAIAAALGAGAAVARYRYRTAIAADSETADEEVMADSTGSQAAPASTEGKKPADAKSKDQGAETSANGRVAASGW